MHAYASKDPVFIAMNKTGQRDTKGALGSFCVQCHAPMAFREGLTDPKVEAGPSAGQIKLDNVRFRSAVRGM